jgi:hypothetical protein
MSGMEKLKQIIGPAPSELPYDTLVGNLMLERERINQVLYSAKPTKKAVSKKSKAAPKLRTKKTISRKQAEEILRRLSL